MSVVFAQTNPYFKVGHVALQTDEEEKPVPAPEWIELELAHPTELPLRRLEAAFGPTAKTYTPGHARTTIRDVQQETARPCELTVETNWDPRIAPTGTVVTVISIHS